MTLRCDICHRVVGTIEARIFEALEQAIAEGIVIEKVSKVDEIGEVGDVGEVLTGMSEFCQSGQCEKCPGQGEIAGKIILCTHSCHPVPAEGGRLVN